MVGIIVCKIVLDRMYEEDKWLQQAYQKMYKSLLQFGLHQFYL